MKRQTGTVIEQGDPGQHKPPTNPHRLRNTEEREGDGTQRWPFIQPGHSQPQPQSSHRQPHLQPGHEQPSVHQLPFTQPSHGQPQPGHKQQQAQSGNGQPHTQLGHGQPHTQPDHGQPSVQELPQGHSQPHPQSGHGQPHAQPGHGQPQILPGHGQTHAQPGHWPSVHQLPFTQPGHWQPHPEPDIAQPHAQPDQGQPHTQAGRGQPSVHQLPFTQPCNTQPHAQPDHGQPSVHQLPFTHPGHRQPYAQPVNGQPHAQPGHGQLCAQLVYGQPRTQPGHEQPHMQPGHEQPSVHQLPFTQPVHGQLHAQPCNEQQHAQPGHGQLSFHQQPSGHEQPLLESGDWQPPGPQQFLMDSDSSHVSGQRQPTKDLAEIPSSGNIDSNSLLFHGQELQPRYQGQGPNVVTYQNTGNNSYNRPSMCGHDINRPNLGFHNYNRSNVNSHDYNRLNVDSHEYKPNVDRHDNNRLNVNSHDNNWPNFGGHNYQRSNVDNHDNRSSGHNQSKNILNSSFDKSRSVISDKDNYRIIRNPWSDVNNNIFYQDKNGVRSRNRENHDNDRYRKHAFSSRGPHDRENWRDESNKRENQPRPHHDNSTKKNTGDSIRNCDRRYEYRRSSSENRDLKDERKRSYKPDDSREYSSRTSSRKTYDKRSEKRCEIPHKRYTPYQGRDYNQGPHQREGHYACSERNQDFNYNYAREKNQRPSYPYRIHENERMLDSYRTNTKELPQMVNDYERFHVDHKADQINTTFPPRVNENETVSHVNEKAKTQFNENEMSVNRRANSSSEPGRADKVYREAERVQQIQQTNRSRNFHNSGKQLEDCIKERKKYPIQQNDFSFNGVRSGYEKGIPTQAVSNTSSILRSSMQEYSNQNNAANKSSIGVTILPSRNCDQNVEQDILNNNSSKENTFGAGSLDFSFQNLPSVMTDHNSYPSSEVRENHQRNIGKRDNVLDHYGDHLKSGFDINGNVCLNMDNRDDRGNISHISVCSEMEGKDLNVSQIPFSDIQPNQNIVQTRQVIQGEKLIDRKEKNEFINENQTIDPYHINENLSLIKQQCFMAHENAKTGNIENQNNKDFKNPTVDPSETDSHKLWVRSKVFDGNHPPERQNNHEAINTRKNTKTQGPVKEVCINGKDSPNQIIDFSFLRHPPPLSSIPVASTLSDTVSNTLHQPPPLDPSKKPTYETTQSQVLQPPKPEGGKPQSKTQQTKSSDLFSINLKEQTPAIPNSSKTQVTKVMETKEKPINSKVPPLPPHEIIKLTETECQDSSNIQEEKKDINNNISPSLYDSQSSEQIDRSKSEKSSAEESLNGPLEKNDTSAEPRNFRIPLKGNAESKFRPFRPWTTCSPKTKTSRKKDRGNNADQRKLDSITVNSNIEVNETEMKKLMNEISSENKLGKQSKKVTSGASNKRSSKKPKLSQKTESKRKKPKKQSHLRKLLGKSVPYLELLKLSAIAKPRVNIVSSGLTSVVNQNVDPSSLQMKSLKSCLKTNERSVADAEFHDVNKNHLKTNMEFHKLGLGNKSLLKPHGEQTSAKLHKLKSSLDLGSMKNLNKIANGIKQKAKWLEKHKSMLNEVNKVKKSNGKTNQRKEHVCGTKSFRKSGKINLASLHPKMRHKIEKLSAGSPVELDEELIKTMPNVSVDIQKCDKLASTSGHGIKIDKAAFMKALNLLKNKMPAKKFVNLMKRGQFTMPTPTTFIVKPRKVVKHRAHTDFGHTDESDVENESERLDKACEAAKQRLLERRTKAGTDPPELVLEKGAKNNNLVDDENKLEIADEDNLLVNTVESDTITDSYASEMPSLWPRDEGTDSEQLNMGVKASESNMQMMGDEIICNPNVYSEAVSGGSPDTSECTNSPDTTLASELNKAYSSEMENKTTATQSNGNADKTNFSINNLIKSEKKKVSDPGESVMVKAEVYHIEHRYIERRVAVTSYPVDENEKKLCPYDSPVVTERGTDNNEYGFCEEASNALDWKRNSDDDDGYTEMEGFGSKPFIAVPLDLPDNPDEHLNLSDTMIDFGLEHMKTDETNNSPISRSHNAVSSDFIKNFQNDKEISPEMHLSEFNENLGGSFDNQNNIGFSIAQQNMFDPMIMGTNAERENLDTNEGNMDEFIQTNNQICEESCKRNFFESIVDDVMHDEDLMKNWTEEKTETASNEYTSPLNLSPAVPECSDTSEKSTPECKTVLETEMQDYDSKNQNKVRQPVSFNEVVNKFSPFVSLEKLAHSSETGITNNDLKEKEARFISERTPLRMKDFRKRKYVKRFPVPLPRVKNKDHEQEKELYEAAKKFLGDFNDTVKRACRMKKAIKEEEKTAEVEMENGSKKPKQLHNEGMVDQPLSSQFISEIKRKQPYKSNENEGMISKAKNVKQEMIQNLTNQDTSINANVEESVKSIPASRTETSNSNLCFVKSLKKGTKRKSPILIISKGSVAKDLHDPENEVNENDIELKRIKVENMTVKKSQKSEGKERKPEKVKASIKRENSKTTKPKLDMSRWCVRCNMMFLSQEFKKRHIRNDHDVKSPCSICGVEYCNQWAYRKHLNSKIHQINLAELQRLSPSFRTKKMSPNQPLKSPKLGKSDDHLREIEKLLKSPDKLSDAKKARLEKTKTLLKSPKVKQSKDKAIGVNVKMENVKDTTKLLRSPKLNAEKTDSKIRSRKKTVPKSSTEILLKSPKPNVQKKTSSKEPAEKLLKSPHKTNAGKISKKETEKLLKSPLKHKQALTKKTAWKETGKRMKSPKLKKLMKSPKVEKLSNCGKGKGAKVKGKKVENDSVEDKKPSQKIKDTKANESVELETEFYCSVCEQFYTSNKTLKNHLKTEKHITAVAQGPERMKSVTQITAQGPDRVGLNPLKIKKAVRKESGSSDVNSSIDYSEAEYYQDQVFGNQTDDDEVDGFQLPRTYFELSDGDKLRQLALDNPTFLVKDFNQSSHQSYIENNAPGTYSYLGLGIDPQQGLKGQGCFQGHPDEFQGEGHLSSSAIGGIVRESFISLLSSEDEGMDPPYKIYQNLDSSADESCFGNETSNKGTCDDLKGDKSDINMNVSEKTAGSLKDRPISISSEDADFTESVLSGTNVPKVTKLKTPPLSPNPICRIQNCYSLAFKGEQRESK